MCCILFCVAAPVRENGIADYWRVNNLKFYDQSKLTRVLVYINLWQRYVYVALLQSHIA